MICPSGSTARCEHCICACPNWRRSWWRILPTLCVRSTQNCIYRNVDVGTVFSIGAWGGYICQYERSIMIVSPGLIKGPIYGCAKLLKFSANQSPSWKAYNRSRNQKFPAFYGNRNSIFVFTTARHLSLSWAICIHESIFLKIQFNITFPSTSTSENRLNK
jgi:hypothetical protein